MLFQVPPRRLKLQCKVLPEMNFPHQFRGNNFPLLHPLLLHLLHGLLGAELVSNGFFFRGQAVERGEVGKQHRNGNVPILGTAGSLF
jgi:hypothetical protein